MPVSLTSRVRSRSLGLLVVLVGTAAAAAGLRYYRAQQFLNDRQPFGEIRFDVCFEDALSDPRNCTVTQLDKLTLSGTGVFEFRNGQQTRKGKYNVNEVERHLSQFLKLQPLATVEPEVSHSPGAHIGVHFEDDQWSAPIDHFRVLSLEELQPAYVAAYLPRPSEVTRYDLVGTFTTRTLSALPESEQKLLAQTESPEKVRPSRRE